MLFRSLSGRSWTVQGKASRVSQLGLGVMTQGEALAALLKYAEADPVTDEGAGDGEAPALQGVKDAVLTWLPAQLRAFTDQSEARLVARASKAHSNAEQTPFFDAITELRRRSSELETEMVDTIFMRLDDLGTHFQTSNAGSSGPQLSELSLVDINEFEISLSVKGMAGKAESRNERALQIGRAHV